MKRVYDVVVLGSGPAGLYAALESSRRGLSTAVVESSVLGGTGFRTGAVPVKRLLARAKAREQAEAYLRRHHPEFHGEYAKTEPPTLEAILRGERQALPQIEEGIVRWLQRMGVELLRGEGRFTSPHSYRVNGESCEAKAFILASGTSPTGYEGIPLDGNRLISHRDIFGPSHSDLLTDGRLSKGLVILGGDVEGVEFAQAFALFGAEVTVVEQEGELLPWIDEDLKEPVIERLEGLGVRVLTGLRAVSIFDEELICKDGGGNTHRIAAPTLLVTGSRAFNFPEGLEEIGVKSSAEGVSVDRHLRTSIPHIFAAGEITGRGGPANVAAVQGIAAAEGVAAVVAGAPAVAGETTERRGAENASAGDCHSCPPPRAVFTLPEIAGVGYSEKDLRQKGLGYRVHRRDLRDTWRGFTRDDEGGFVKLLSSEADEILGIWWSSNEAADMLSTLSAALRPASSDLGMEGLLRAPYIHPTLAEVYRDIFLDNSHR